MTARPRRVSTGATASSGGVTAALTRRTRRPVAATATEETAAPAPTIAAYFGEDEDTPVMQLIKRIPPVTQAHRGGPNVHVSDVISKCLRKVVLMENMKLRHPSEKIMDGQGITFAIGDALHDYVTDRVIKGHPDRVWAEWRCACGESRERSEFSRRQVLTCPSCGTSTDKHNEVAFPDAEWMLTGSPDIILKMDEYGAYYIVEVKSISAAGWKELVRPVPDHVIQVTFYWHLLQRAGWPLVDKVSILYVNKEFSFKLPYKEFMVDPQRPGILDPYLEDLRALRVAREGGDLPSRTFCATMDSPGAKKCPVSVTCFGCSA